MTEWREWVAWRRIVRVADDPMESAAAVGVDAARARRGWLRPWRRWRRRRTRKR